VGAEHDRLRAEFGPRHWTGLSMDALCKAVATEFPEQEGHLACSGRVDALLHRHANPIVHNSFLSIGGAFSSIEADGGMTFDVGGSKRFIPNALCIAFFSYINLTSLVVEGEVAEALARLWHEDKDAFTVEHEARTV
jgi:hypothetical protein